MVSGSQALAETVCSSESPWDTQPLREAALGAGGKDFRRAFPWMGGVWKLKRRKAFTVMGRNLSLGCQGFSNTWWLFSAQKQR